MTPETIPMQWRKVYHYYNDTIFEHKHVPNIMNAMKINMDDHKSSIIKNNGVFPGIDVSSTSFELPIEDGKKDLDIMMHMNYAKELCL